MLKDRVFQTFVVTIILLAAFSFIKPASPDPEENVQSARTGFFIAKAHQRGRFDGVIVGDSRGLHGISPSVMSQVLAGNTIYNVSFNAGGMNEEIFAYAESLLDPEAEKPMIIVAPTALTFMPHKRANSQYREYLAKPRDQVWLYQEFPGLAQALQAVSPSVYLRKFWDLKPRKLLYQEYHADGWIETDQVPHDESYQLDLAEGSLSRFTIDPEIIDGVMDQTRRWTRAGIQVFGLIPPADADRKALEDSVLGFDEAAFARDFTDAGGTWIDLEDQIRDTYDGSHLTGPAAREFSRQLAEAIARHR
jgi:hypothetical protein